LYTGTWESFLALSVNTATCSAPAHLPGSLLDHRISQAALLPILSAFSNLTAPTIISADLALMTKNRPQAHKHTAKRGLRATEQAQLQPPQTDHCHMRPNIATWRRNTFLTAIAVPLCFISMAAAQPGQCPAAWTTAALSVARYQLAATSLPNQGFAVFAGGTHVDLF
jgi:hypothetical protein